MAKTNDLIEWISRKKNVKILEAFQFPTTPRQAEKLLGIKKITLRPFLKNRLLRLLNTGAVKGRFYVTTSKARRLLNLPLFKSRIRSDWCIVGWILASPRQRTIILKVLNSVKRTSDEIMRKALKFNNSVTRISTKTILSELIGKGLVETELKPKLRRIIRGCPIYGKKLRRFYWLSGKGKVAQKDVESVLKEGREGSEQF